MAWKFADAAALESELIKVAIEMEASVLSKTGGDTSPDTERSEDLQVSVACHWPVWSIIQHTCLTMPACGCEYGIHRVQHGTKFHAVQQ